MQVTNGFRRSLRLQPVSTLTDIPDEVLTQVFAALDTYAHLKTAAAVAWRWHDPARSEHATRVLSALRTTGR